MPRLPGLQLLRALAALLVLIGHVLGEAQHYFAVSLPITALPWTRGVDLFFVISGFIITLSASRRLDQPGVFLWRRFLRVAPLYYLFTTAMVATLLLLPGATKGTELEPGQIISSYLFLPFERHDGRIAPVLSLGWTLNYEMFFYVLMAFSLCLRRPFVALALLMLTFSAACLFRWNSTTAQFYSNPIVIEFLFGIGLAQLFRRNIVLPSTPLALLAVAAGLALLVTLHQTTLPRFVAAGLPAMIIVAGGTLFCPPLAPARLLLRLGDASYVLYLSHRFTLRALTLLLLPYLPTGPAGLWGFVMLACTSCLMVSLLVHRWIELPLLRLLYLPRRIGAVA
ncbi:hypothetical protein A9Q94_00450 [Rhodobacterales bacterium 56_14_T64]|nr:hypothetical protein A9Q94_00450 [Rhodobacterales bacterium 56_14_T64]